MVQRFSTLINTLSSTAGTTSTSADGYVSGGVAFVKNLPSMQWKGIKSLILKRALKETANVVVISGTKANSTTYSFTIQQNISGSAPKFTNVSYTSDATATATEIKDKLVAAITAANVSGQCSVTATGAVNSNDFTVTLTGASGMPMFSVLSLVNVTQASGMPTLNPNATPATAVAGTSTVTITVLASQSFATGETVTITGATGFTFTKDGVATVGTVTARITYASATTFTLDNVTGSGTNSGTVTITKVAQEAYGQPSEVEADVNFMPSGESVSSTYQYDSATFVLENGNVNNLWIKANLIASTYTANTNLSTMRTTLDKLQTAAASGTAIPELALQTS